MTYLVKQSKLDHGKYNTLLNGFKAYDNDYSNMINNQYPLFGEGERAKIDKWFDENRGRRDSLIYVARSYGCYDNSSYLASDREKAMQNCLKYRIDDINDEAFSFAKKWFFISLLILIAGRYLFFASKWVATKSK